MSNLTTLPKGDSAWLLRKSIQRVMQQISVLETNIGSSTTGNSNNTEIIFNDAGTLRGDKDFAWNKTSNILTVDGSATITGDLTVDTSTLKVDSANDNVGIGTTTPASYAFNDPVKLAIANTGTAGAGNTFTIASGSTGFGQIAFANGTSGTSRYNGYIKYSHSTNAMEFYTTAGALQATLNATGLGVGVAPSAWESTFKAIQINNRGAYISATSNSFSTAPFVQIGNNGYYDSVNARWQYVTANTASQYVQAASSHYWYTAASGAADAAITDFATAKMTLDASGNLLVGVTSANASGGVLQLSSGITFPATQVASSDANTLDDYEEGTFTPTVVGSSTAGTATYATQSGRYVKIGRQVTAWIHLDWSGGTGTGNLRFGGLPFTIITLATNNYPSAAIGYINGIALSANNIAVAYGQNAEAAVNLGQYPIGGGSGSSVAYDAAGQIIFTITYEV